MLPFIVSGGLVEEDLETSLSSALFPQVGWPDSGTKLNAQGRVCSSELNFSYRSL